MNPPGYLKEKIQLKRQKQGYGCKDYPPPVFPQQTGQFFHEITVRKTQKQVWYQAGRRAIQKTTRLPVQPACRNRP